MAPAIFLRGPGPGPKTGSLTRDGLGRGQEGLRACRASCQRSALNLRIFESCPTLSRLKRPDATWPMCEYRSCRAPTSLPPLVQRTQVVIRVRPVLPDDAGDKEPPAVTCETPTTVQARPLPLRPRSSLAPPTGYRSGPWPPAGRDAVVSCLPGLVVGRDGRPADRPTSTPTSACAHRSCSAARARSARRAPRERPARRTPGASRLTDASGRTPPRRSSSSGARPPTCSRCARARLRMAWYGMAWRAHSRMRCLTWPAGQRPLISLLRPSHVSTHFSPFFFCLGRAGRLLGHHLRLWPDRCRQDLHHVWWRGRLSRGARNGRIEGGRFVALVALRRRERFPRSLSVPFSSRELPRTVRALPPFGAALCVCVCALFLLRRPATCLDGPPPNEPQTKTERT